MLFTRSFGALRARSMMFATTERNEDETGRRGDVRFLDDDANRTDRDRESVA